MTLIHPRRYLRARGVSQLAKDIFLPKGEFVFREAETAEYAYVLKAGEVEIVKTGLDGEMILSTLTSANALFGEMALIDGEPRSAGARAKTDVTVTEIHQGDFLKYIQKNPRAAMNVMKQLSRGIRSANTATSHRGEFASSTTQFTEKVLPSASKSLELDDTDSIYDTPSSKTVMYLSGVLLLILVCGIIFSLTAVIDITVSTRGKFATELPNVAVQATTGAVVRQVLATRGELVKKNQLLVVLDSTAAVADLVGNDERLAAVTVRLERLQLEQKILQTGVELGEGHSLDELNLEILNKRLDKYRSKLRFFDAKLEQMQRELAYSDAEIAAAKRLEEITARQVEMKEEIKEVHADLYKANHTSLLSYLEASDVLLGVQRSHFESKNIIEQKKALHKSKALEVDSIREQRNEFVAEWLSGLGEALAEDKELQGQLSQEALKFEQNVQNVEVRAPIDGIVLNLPTVSVGSVVQNGEPLITLVPTDQPVTLEVDINPKDITEIKLGLPVSIKLDALPFQQYGDIKGVLSYVSEDTYDTSLSGDDGAFYRGRVQVRSGATKDMPTDFRLVPGMLAGADIKVGARKLFTYLANPIVKGFSKAFTEPN